MNKVSKFFMLGLMVSFCMSGLIFSATLVDTTSALDSIFPDKDSIDNVKVNMSAAMISRLNARSQSVNLSIAPGKDEVFYVAKKSGKIIGIAVVDTEQGKWGKIDFLVAVDANTSKIQEMVVLAFEEKRGRPIARKTFLEQFIGKGPSDPIEVNKDIKGISGATISSKAAANSAKDGIAIIEEVYKKR
jgi:Na+-translocating ferredoxin:NAD+ oxidoreductase RnfG subunit